MPTRRLLIAIPAAVTLTFLLTASSCDEKGLGDAPIGTAHEDERDVIVMPDQFPNLVVACDGNTRIYVTTREAPPVVVPDHPLCRGEDPITEQGEQIPGDEFSDDGGEG